MPKKVASKKVVSNSIRAKHNERVMVVSREDLFRDGIWNGIRTENLQKYLNIINTKHKFLPRGEVESDPKWKQIIPYLVFENNGRLFLMRRKADHTDLRLANNYSLGIGGHVNLKDVTKVSKGTKVSNGSAFTDWAKREFEEEIDYKGTYKTKFVGILNHDANDVGMVHAGLVMQVEGNSDDIAVRDEHKSGEMVPLEEASKYYKQMETWSQIVYDYMRAGGTKPVSSSDVSGILPDWLIEKNIREGNIKITPLPKNWQEAIDQVSMDFHLGTHMKLFRGGTYRYVDTRKGLPADAMEEVNLNEGDPFILEPGAFAIASTKEVLKLPADIIGRLEGKSSLARLGIIVHSTAARFDPGWNGAPVLELGNLGPKPAILYSGMPICAFTFERIGAPVKMPYEGSRSDRYSGSKDAIASKIEKV
ncbi:MAG TPA: dCTP deaminase [Candidatus Saccharimonadales bacterium]|nr:dCTP deaminase [Candidatus Saccharimonadales bacterium]